VERLAIHTDRLTRKFQSICAVDNLSLNVERGTIYGLLGPSGSGKSTLVRLLLGLLEPTSGSALVLGLDPTRAGAAVRAQCGVVLQSPSLYGRLTAEQNLDLFGRIWGLEKNIRAQRTEELLTHFGLWERRKEAASRLSRGMQRRLALARALLPRPALLFLDQPSAGLDASLAEPLHRDLAVLAAEEDVTVFLTTETLADVEQICRRIGLMRDGRLLAEGSPADLGQSDAGTRLEIVGWGFTDAMIALVSRRREVRHIEAGAGRLWVDLQPDGHAAPVVNLLVESGAQVEQVLRHQPSLENVYRAILDQAPTGSCEEAIP
jgi:ABC-2 type transport system ATP-binding protein